MPQRDDKSHQILLCRDQSFAQRHKSSTHSLQKKTADQSGCFTPGLWKRWREQHSEGRGVIIISVFRRGICSCKIQRAAVSNLAVLLLRLTKGSISRALSVPFPSVCPKRNINNTPPHPQKPSQMLCTPGEDTLLQHQAKDHPSSQGLLYHTFVQMCERMRHWELIYADML